MSKDMIDKLQAARQSLAECEQGFSNGIPVIITAVELGTEYWGIGGEEPVSTDYRVTYTGLHTDLTISKGYAPEDKKPTVGDKYTLYLVERENDGA